MRIRLEYIRKYHTYRGVKRWGYNALCIATDGKYTYTGKYSETLLLSWLYKSMQ